MRRGPTPKPIQLTSQQRAELELFKNTEKPRIARRAETVLLCMQPISAKTIAHRLGCFQQDVSKWRKRYLEFGIAGLRDEKRQGRPKKSFRISKSEREILERYIRRGTISQNLANRARICLLCSDDIPNAEIAQRVGVNAKTVGKWRKRFINNGVQALTDDYRPGTPRKVTDEIVEQVVVKTLETKPKGATHWSTRDMAANVGLSQKTVSRIWQTFGLKPHLSETYQLSTDPLFIEKVRDVVGLYISPPDNALVLCVDEKSQIQALNRTQPLLPLRSGQAERATPEYQRNGTTTLFAALDRVSGKVIGKCYPRHRAEEFRKFLNVIRKNVPADMDIHIICDNYSTHSAPTIKRWLARNPRFHIHFTPTHSSWLNQVETWFSILTEKQIKRGTHHSVTELQAAINEFLDVWNENPGIDHSDLRSWEGNPLRACGT